MAKIYVSNLFLWGLTLGRTSHKWKSLVIFRASFIAQLAKNPPAMQETWVQSLGWKDPLEGGMAPRSSTLACRVPWTGEPDGLQSMGLQSWTRLSSCTELK